MEKEIDMLDLIKRAERGDPEAMVDLADYKRRQNEDEEAYQLVKKASLYSNPRAERRFGYYHEKGIGTEIDYKKAFDYYELSAKHGDYKAKYNLAVLLQGKGCIKDPSRAFTLAKESSENYYGKAFLLLAYFYEHGVGCEQDYQKALECYLKALDAGSKNIYHKLGLYAYYGYGLDKDLPLAFSYFYKGASENEVACYYYLGVMYAKGEGIEKDLAKAFYWYQMGANNGDMKSMYNVAIYYENGIYVPKDDDKAYYWMKKSANLGFDLAINKMQIKENR